MLLQIGPKMTRQVQFVQIKTIVLEQRHCAFYDNILPVK